MRIAVPASREPAAGFRLSEPADIVMRSDDGPFAYKMPNGVSGSCASPCVIPFAVPGPYRLEADEPRKVTIEIKAPIERQAIDRERTIKLVPEATGDARGRVAEATIDVPVPGARVQLGYRPVFVKGTKEKRKPPQGRETRRVLDTLKAMPVELLGPRHSIMNSRSVDPKDGWYTLNFDAEPGRYVLRVAPQPPRTLDVTSVEVRVESFEREALGGTAVPPISQGRDLVVLGVEGKLTVEAEPRPALRDTWISVEPESDIAWTWDHASLSVSVGDKRLSDCNVSPCFAVGARGLTRIATSRLDEAATVDVILHRLPTPPISLTLPLGSPIDVQTVKQAGDDPRGAFFDFAVDVEAGAALVVTAKAEGDFASGTIVDAADRLARISVIRGSELLEVPRWATPFSEPGIRQGVSFTELEAAKSGRLVLRLDGQGHAPPRKISLRHERGESKEAGDR